MSEQLTNLHLPTGSDPYERVTVHPVVVFNILDHFIRRPETSGRVIGTLLGSINEEEGTVEIRNCFPVPHTETDQIAVNLDFHRTLTNLHQKVSPDDVIVGWYATGREVKESSSLIHNFYWREMNQAPVHLLLDTDLSTGKIQLATYHAISIALSDKGTLQQHFLPLPNEYSVQDHDRISFDVLSQAKTGKPTLLSDLNNLEYNLQRLLNMLETTSQYVDNVVAGKETPNNEVGRFLQETLSLLPTNELAFDQMFTNGVQDVLVVIYLANLTRSHLLLAEKLRDQAAAVPAAI